MDSILWKEMGVDADGNQPQRNRPGTTFLLLSYYGAKEFQLSIKTYFSRPEHVVEAQLRMR